jgi:RluA family pseudouridine synthase
VSWTEHPLLFEDEWLVVIDKPSGVLSHPNPGALSAKNRGAFEGRYDFNQKSFSTPSGKLWLLHRLDQDTSGLLLAAKNEKMARALREAFDAGKIQKNYLALVRGLAEPKGQWRDHLSLSRDGGKVRTRVVRGAEINAELRFKLCGASASHRVSLLEIELLTGRTHQIRVQAASRQHVLAGDDLYGDFSWNRKLRSELGLKRLFLHAALLAFVHPQTRKKLLIQAPLSKELEPVLQGVGL